MSQLRAVVDIGSNSVRLVVYEGPARAPAPVYNEKALCGLGAGVAQAGRFDPAARADAVATLARFRATLDQMEVSDIFAFATAATREASDGPAFIAEAADLGFDVRILTGEEEARAAAYGVLCAEPSARGLVGDLGGGSLELVAVEDGGLGERTSLPLGPLRLKAEAGGDLALASKQIAATLAGVDWLGRFDSPTLYTVGGAWRAIARVHMAMADYPLAVLHHYRLSREEALATCDYICDLDAEGLENLPGAPRKRLTALPYAAAALKGVLEASEACASIVSAAGAREGVLYEQLSDADRAKDPLIEGARDLAARLSPNPAFGEGCVAATAGLFFEETPAEARVRRATCLLADIGALFHPDARADQAFETALSAPFLGLDHPERVSIALSLFRRHAGRRAAPTGFAALRLLGEGESDRAARLGLALRLLGVLAPKSAAAGEVRLVLENDRLTIAAPERFRPMFSGETAEKRIGALAEQCAATSEIVFS
ncbi:MAG: Ppx/GppA family phosphatase [Pseudomonadota bacterium]